MSLNGKPMSPEFALISESVDNANARIRFLRVAYGMASPGQMVNKSEIMSILEAVSAGMRVSFDWTPVGEISRARVQEVFLALQCFESAMPLGGVISVAQLDADQWEISGAAEPNRPDPALWQALSDPASHATIVPAHVQFAMLSALLTERGRRITVETRTDDTVIRF